jgi:hypothetical protein
MTRQQTREKHAGDTQPHSCHAHMTETDAAQNDSTDEEKIMSDGGSLMQRLKERHIFSMA